MNPRVLLFAYLGALVAISLLHSPALLATLLLFAFIASGQDRLALLRASVRALAVFTLTVGLSWLLYSWLWQGAPDGRWLLLVILRVLLMVYLGLWFVRRVPLMALLERWPSATLLATLTLSQIAIYRRLLADFRLAFTSRRAAPPRLTDRARHAGAQGIVLLDKSLAAAADAAQALRSRGVFDLPAPNDAGAAR